MLAISVGLFMLGSHYSLQLLETEKWRAEDGKVPDSLSRSLTMVNPVGERGGAIIGTDKGETISTVKLRCQCAGTEK
jgi:hypothetical protein